MRDDAGVLDRVRVAVLAADGFEQVELTHPRAAFEDAGAEVEVVSLRRGKIQGMNLLVPGKRVPVDRTLGDADPDDYGALLVPGGFINPDFLRQSERALDFVRAFEAAGKPIAVICHGPWVLVSAGLVAGRRLTSWPGIRDDVSNAGGEWVDKAVVHDDNWVSSRGPQDLRAFSKAAVRHFAALALRTPVSDARSRHAPSRGAGPWVAGGLIVAAAAAAMARRADEHDASDGEELLPPSGASAPEAVAGAEA
jgi:protease I